MSLGLYTLLTLLLHPAPVFAGAVDDACPAVERVASQIQKCSENRRAADQAETCARALRAEWRPTRERLQRVLAGVVSREPRGQENQLDDAGDGFENAHEETQRMVRLLQRGADTVAAYAGAMLDYPDAVATRMSATCFEAPFQRLQRTVTALDAEIIQAKALREQLTRLLGTQASRSQGLGTLTGAGGPLRTGAPQAVPRGQSRPVRERESDITGTPPPAAPDRRPANQR